MSLALSLAALGPHRPDSAVWIRPQAVNSLLMVKPMPIRLKHLNPICSGAHSRDRPQESRCFTGISCGLYLERRLLVDRYIWYVGASTG
jgi:hypothetical protein